MKLPSGILTTAAKTSLVVGSVLTAINHGAALMAGPPTAMRLVQVALCYAVPFGVSFHSQLAMSRRAASRWVPASVRPTEDPAENSERPTV